MDIFKIINRIVGTAAFTLMVWAKYNGNPIEFWWLLIPAVFMGLSTQDSKKAIKDIKELKDTIIGK